MWMKTPSFRVVTMAQCNILLALAKYKFLTPSHLVALGIMSKTKGINKALSELREGLRKNQPLTTYQSFGGDEDGGKKEYFHFLTKYGKQALVEHLGLFPEEIKLLIGTATPFLNDYKHRKHTLSCEIALNLWAEAHQLEIPFCNRYFDTLGNNRRNKNLRSKNKFKAKHGSFFVPDMAFQIKDFSSQKESLFVFEMYNDKNTLRKHEQLKKHVEAIELGSISDVFEVSYGHQVLLVFSKTSMLEATFKRIQNDPFFINVKDFFLFKAFNEIKSQPARFGENWFNLRGEKVSLFVLAKTKENEHQQSLENF